MPCSSFRSAHIPFKDQHAGRRTQPFGRKQQRLYPSLAEFPDAREQIRPLCNPGYRDTCASVAQTAQPAAMPIMTLLSDPAAWAALLTLIVMEVVLGIDNLVFVAIL